MFKGLISIEAFLGAVFLARSGVLPEVDNQTIAAESGQIAEEEEKEKASKA